MENDTEQTSPIDNSQKQANTPKKINRPLRTFQDDVASFVKDKKISTASIVMAEQERRIKEGTDTVKKGVDATKKFFMGMRMSVVLIILGIAVVLLAIIFINPIEKINNFVSGPSDVDDALFDKKDEVVIRVDNKISSEIKSDIKREINSAPFLNENEIFEIKLVGEVSTTLSNGRSQFSMEKIDAETFMTLLELNAPGSLKRSLSDDYLLGVIGTQDGNTPFILLGIDDFDRVFSGMLDWEISIYRDVNDYFDEKLPTNDFATSEEFLYLNNLRDIIIFNRDARAIIDNDDNIEFFYTFVNDDYLLLAEDTSIVDNIANKLNLQSLIR